MKIQKTLFCDTIHEVNRFSFVDVCEDDERSSAQLRCVHSLWLEGQGLDEIFLVQ